MKELKKYRKYFILALLLLFTGAMLLFYYSQENLTHWNFDSLEYAQIARNIARGEGVCVNSYPVMGLVLLKNINHLEVQKCWPNFNRYILTAVLLAPFFKLFGASEHTLFLFFGIWFFTGIIIFYFLALKIFGQKVAFWSVLLFASSFKILNHAVFGALELLDISLFLLFLLLIYHPKYHFYYYLAAFVFGLSYLNHYVNLFFLPLFLLYLYFALEKGKRFRTLIIFCGIFLATISPLLAYNFHYTKNLLFSFQTSAMVAGRTNLYPLASMVDRKLLIINPLFFILHHPLAMAAKSLILLKETIKNLPFKLLDSTLVFFMAVLFFLLPRSQAAPTPKPLKIRHLDWFPYLILTVFGINLLIYSLFVAEVRYFTIFAPSLILFAVGLICGLPLKRQLVLLIILFLSNLYPFVSYSQTKPKTAKPLYFLSDYAYIRESTGKQDVLMGEDREIGWFADRKAISLPDNFGTIKTIQEEYLPIRGIYICSGLSREPYCAQLEENEGSIPGFYLKKKFESGALYFERID